MGDAHDSTPTKSIIAPPHLKGHQMRAWIIAFAIVAGGQALDAGLETANVYGIGGNSCASWLSSNRNETEGDIWVLGYWSGRNDANAANHKVGRRPALMA
jgi:hypothetical protein